MFAEYASHLAMGYKPFMHQIYGDNLLFTDGESSLILYEVKILYEQDKLKLLYEIKLLCYYEVKLLYDIRLLHAYEVHYYLVYDVKLL